MFGTLFDGLPFMVEILLLISAALALAAGWEIRYRMEDRRPSYWNRGGKHEGGVVLSWALTIFGLTAGFWGVVSLAIVIVKGTLSGGFAFVWPVLLVVIPLWLFLFWLSTEINYSRLGTRSPSRQKIRDFPDRLYVIDYDFISPAMWILAPVIFLLPIVAVWISFGALWIVIPFMTICALMAITSQAAG